MITEFSKILLGRQWCIFSIHLCLPLITKSPMEDKENTVWSLCFGMKLTHHDTLTQKLNKSKLFKKSHFRLTYWGRMSHICVSKLGYLWLSPDGRQAIIWTNAEILLIEPLEMIFSEIFFEIYTFPFKKMHFKMSSGKWRPSFLGPNQLKILIFFSRSWWMSFMHQSFGSA